MYEPTEQPNMGVCESVESGRERAKFYGYQYVRICRGVTGNILWLADWKPVKKPDDLYAGPVE